MARFASEAELKTFLGRLNPDYSPFASTLWQKGVKTVFQLANARESILLACGLSELYIDDIKARADRTVDSQKVMRVELTQECIASLSQGVASITLKNFMEPNVLIAVHDQWDKFANPIKTNASGATST